MVFLVVIAAGNSNWGNMLHQRGMVDSWGNVVNGRSNVVDNRGAVF